MNQDRVNFGHDFVETDEKTRRVGNVFRTVADRYDVMNDVMSFGLHRIFKRIAIETTSLRPGSQVLDVAGGTGDLCALLADVVGRDGQVILLDINESMTKVGRDKLINSGYAWIQTAVADAEMLPFPDDYFDAITIAFGLRNMTNKDSALTECHRVLKPGGTLVILEFSKPKNPLLKTVYRLYQQSWPFAGQLIAGDSAPYRYLIESIDVHPNQSELNCILADAGFHGVRYENLLGGLVAIHRAVK
ncbi:MAG: class I SAM-dependent methyltransferase [Pseudomonadales bacterium]